MDGWTDGWMDAWMDGWMGRATNLNLICRAAVVVVETPCRDEGRHCTGGGSWPIGVCNAPRASVVAVLKADSNAVARGWLHKLGDQFLSSGRKPVHVQQRAEVSSTEIRVPLPLVVRTTTTTVVVTITIIHGTIVCLLYTSPSPRDRG